MFTSTCLDCLACYRWKTSVLGSIAQLFVKQNFQMTHCLHLPQALQLDWLMYILSLCCSDFCIGSLTMVLHSALQMISNGRCTLQSNYTVEFEKQMFVIILLTYLLHAFIPGVALKSCVYAWIKIFFYLTAVSVF